MAKSASQSPNSSRSNTPHHMQSSPDRRKVTESTAAVSLADTANLSDMINIRQIHTDRISHIELPIAEKISPSSVSKALHFSAGRSEYNDEMDSMNSPQPSIPEDGDDLPDLD